MKKLPGLLVGIAALCVIVAGATKIIGAGLYFHGGGWAWMKFAEFALFASIAISLLPDKK